MSFNQFKNYNANVILKDYFKDSDTFNFKYGLDYGLYNGSTKPTRNTLNNLDEDPTIFGFDLFILDQSPLFNGMTDFFSYADDHNIPDILNRREIYNDVRKQLSKFINITDNSNNGQYRNNSFKSHYINSIENIDRFVNYVGIGNDKSNQFANYGIDKITVELSEDVGLNAGYLAGVYRDFIYSKINGRQVIPENLIRFDLVIVISEIRNFNRVANSLLDIQTIDSLTDSNRTNVINKSTQTFNDNISRYIFTLSECSFDFNTYSFENRIDIAGLSKSMPEFSKGLKFDIYYKYVKTEIEKFELNINLRDDVKYINDSSVSPTSNQVNVDANSRINRETTASATDKIPSRLYDIPFRMNNNDNTDPSVLRSYQFDFPMINAKYAIRQNNININNIETAQGQNVFRRGLNDIINRLNNNLQTGITQQRALLISDLAANVRGRLGIRRISAPENVYVGTNLGQYLRSGDLKGFGQQLRSGALDQVRSFANVGLSGILGTGADFLSKQAKGIESNIFDKANNVTNGLTGYDAGTENLNALSTIKTNVPNVYNNSKLR